MRKIIASLDIGNHTIKLVVGEIVRGKLNILACVDVPARGIKKGFIVNPETAMLALEDVFKKGEEQIGLPIKKVIVSVPSNGIECFLSEGYTSILHGKVVDMFYFPIIDTYWPEWLPGIGGDRFIFFSPIFNFADAAISCGIIAMLIFYSGYLNQHISKKDEKAE